MLQICLKEKFFYCYNPETFFRMAGVLSAGYIFGMLRFKPHLDDRVYKILRNATENGRVDEETTKNGKNGS